MRSTLRIRFQRPVGWSLATRCKSTNICGSRGSLSAACEPQGAKKVAVRETMQQTHWFMVDTPSGTRRLRGWNAKSDREAYRKISASLREPCLTIQSLAASARTENRSSSRFPRPLRSAPEAGKIPWQTGEPLGRQPPFLVEKWPKVASRAAAWYAHSRPRAPPVSRRSVVAYWIHQRLIYLSRVIAMRVSSAWRLPSVGVVLGASLVAVMASLAGAQTVE